MSIQRREEKSAPSCEREKRALAPLFMFFCSPWASPMQIGLRQEHCLFYLRFSLRSSDLPLFYFHRLSLPGLLATSILDSFSLFLTT